MKLTSKLLKKMIMEEMQQQKLPFPTQDTSPEDKQDEIKGVADFKKKLRDLSVQPTTDFTGLSPSELQAIAQLLTELLDLGQEMAADQRLKRIGVFIDKMAPNRGAKEGSGGEI